MRIAIIGAGIIGLALARELRRRGAEVLLVDPGEPAREATWAAAGLLAPSSEATAPGPFFELCRAAAVGYPDYVRELEDETGLRTGYRCDGTLYAYHTDDERQALERRFGWQRDAGIPIVHLDAHEARVLEPEVSAAGGFLLPGDGSINNRLLAAALVEACRRAGVEFERRRVAAISEISADAIVNAAGAWASQIQAPVALPAVRPVKGHMLSLGGWEPRLVLHDPAIYLVPRGGAAAIGATMEEAGFDKSVHPETIERLRGLAVRLVPRLASAEVVETWTGLRPATETSLPVIGPTPLPGYFVAIGHFRNGILLGPITAQLLAPVVLGEPPDALLRPFYPMN